MSDPDESSFWAGHTARSMGAVEPGKPEDHPAPKRKPQWKRRLVVTFLVLLVVAAVMGGLYVLFSHPFQ